MAWTTHPPSSEIGVCHMVKDDITVTYHICANNGTMGVIFDFLNYCTLLFQFVCYGQIKYCHCHHCHCHSPGSGGGAGIYRFC